MTEMKPVQAEAAVCPASARQLNVIGHITANLGLAVAARGVAGAAVARGWNVTALDIDPGLRRHGFVTNLPYPVTSSPSELPRGINLFVLPPFAIAESVLESKSLLDILTRSDDLHAAFTFWELPVLPPAWARSLELFDAVVAPSTFIEGTMDFALSGTAVVRGLTPVDVPSGVAADRARFGLPADAFVVVCSFDPLSDPERKNPQASIEAFRRAFGDADHARLAVKLNAPPGGYDDPELNRTVLQPLLAQLRADPRIVVITDTLPYRDVLSLYASADAYISLHRAEGLGLGLLESMALGKPVVATGWSGNKVFMSPANSCPVRHLLVPVQASRKTYSAAMKGLRPMWAEPDIDDAARWLRQLAADSSLRARIGTAARGAFEKYQAEATALGFLDDLVALHAHRAAGSDAMIASRRRQRILRVRDEARLGVLSTSQKLIQRVRERFDQHIGWRFGLGRSLAATKEEKAS